MNEFSLVDQLDNYTKTLLEETADLSPTQASAELTPTSRKDTRYVRLLEQDESLKNKITSTMQALAERHNPMPLMHVTTKAVRFEDGNEESTGYIENIQSNGFRARDTNVSAFIDPSNSTHFRSPSYFADNPHKLLRQLDQILEKYGHHGVRTNKQSLGEKRDQGVGVPVMMLIDSREVQLIKGSDNEDHFILHNRVPPDRIMGTVALKGDAIHSLGIITVSHEFVATIDNYLTKDNEGRATTQPILLRGGRIF
jgi:hypothetical protein